MTAAWLAENYLWLLAIILANLAVNLVLLKLFYKEMGSLTDHFKQQKSGTLLMEIFFLDFMLLLGGAILGFSLLIFLSIYSIERIVKMGRPTASIPS